MAFIKLTSTPDIVERWPYSFQHIDDTDPQWDYLGAFASELRRIDVFIDELYEQRYAQSATGRELEKIGAPVGVTREANEDDEEFRLRVRMGKAISASDGTAEDIERVLEIAFGSENLDGIEVTHDTGHPVTRFDIPSSTMNTIPLTAQEFETRLEDAFPCGHGVIVVTSDSFVFGSGGAQGLGNGKLS